MGSEPNPSTPHSGSSPTSTRSTRWLRISLLALAALATVGLARSLGGQLPELVTWVQSLGFWGPAVFVGVYATAVVLFVPGSILTLAGGAIFGIALGTLYVFIAAMIGSSAAFLIARYAARSRIENRLGQNARFEAVARAVAENGLRITFLLRLSPIFPFNFMNYALGLTRVRFRDYFLAGFGMLPATLLYVYSGRVVGDVAAVAGGATIERGAGYYAVVLLGLLATVAVATLVTRIARRALGQVAQT